MFTIKLRDKCLFIFLSLNWKKIDVMGTVLLTLLIFFEIASIQKNPLSEMVLWVLRRIITVRWSFLNNEACFVRLMRDVNKKYALFDY